MSADKGAGGIFKGAAAYLQGPGASHCHLGLLLSGSYPPLSSPAAVGYSVQLADSALSSRLESSQCTLLKQFPCFCA